MSFARDPSSVPRSSAVQLVRSRVARHLAALKLPPTSRIVAAVSGGADSVVLLNALVSNVSQFGIEIHVAHFNHQIRGEAAEDDARFVEGLARNYGLPFHGGSAIVPQYAREHRLSLEDAARQLRRRYLEEVRVATNSAFVALGHTRDDQAETVLLNFLRGAGPRGLGAMPAHGPGGFTRPILRVRRTSIEAYARALDLPYRTDETNADVSMTRNRIRHELIPFIESRFNPAIVDTLSRGAATFRDIEACLSGMAAALYDNPAVIRSDPDGVRLDLGAFGNEPRAVQRTLLRLAIERAAGSLTGWSGRHLAALLDLALKSGPGRLDLPGGVVALKRGAFLEVRRAGAPENDANRVEPESIESSVSLPVRHGAEVGWGGGTLRLSLLAIGPAEGLHHPDGIRSAWFDAAALPDTLSVRRPRPGDRITRFGRAGGGRKLKELFIDRKVPRQSRARHPVVTGLSGDDEIILWVAGLARSAAAPVGNATRTIVFIDWFGSGNT